MLLRGQLSVDGVQIRRCTGARAWPGCAYRSSVSAKVSRPPMMARFLLKWIS